MIPPGLLAAFLLSDFIVSGLLCLICSGMCLICALLYSNLLAFTRVYSRINNDRTPLVHTHSYPKILERPFF
mgnify:CR=1 FL=1